MPDIIICKNSACKFRESCYRYTAKPSEYWQSYQMFEPKSDGCDFFMEIYRVTELWKVER